MDEIDKLIEVVRKLRDPNSGCPWDIKQTSKSIAKYTIEEAYEVVDAIENGDNDDLCEELGDLLLQVVFHSLIAEEVGDFDFNDVARNNAEKMIRRHPHVFHQDLKKSKISIDRIKINWESIKEEERKKLNDNSALAGVAKALPSLKRAEKLGKRAGVVGFDWQNFKGARNKIEEEISELDEAISEMSHKKMEEELGDLLFSVVNLARHLAIDPEKALSISSKKFEKRFRNMEEKILENGKDINKMDSVDLEDLWQQSKKIIG